MNKLDSSLNSIGQSFESMFKSAHILPQQKYFTVPIYKFCVDKIGNVAATGVSFLAADLIMHQLLPQTLTCLASQIIPNDWQDSLGLEDACNLSYDYIKTLYWSAYAIPVMYAKYKRN